MICDLVILITVVYRKPPTISPGLIYFRKRFLMGLYKGGLIYGWAYTWTIFCVSNKQVRHKQVGHKQGNKRVLSSDYWTCINWGTFIRGAYIRVGLYSGGGAYIWKDVSVSTIIIIIFIHQNTNTGTYEITYNKIQSVSI